MIEIPAAQRRALRARAHSLHPVVSISQNGLSETVLAEIDRNLKAHELIKVRVYGQQRDVRAAHLDAICARLDAAPVQLIGNVLVIYRRKLEEVESAPRPKARTKRRASDATATPAAPRRRIRP
jgi:putative YhbY family RNA-binding protein